jgi:diaminohydroxyphosphoribosylaminopyrimidine deaminase/5-amino-6-(5-phosphoribosylamino)uracil reductase
MNHERFMRECLRLALRGKGGVSPNPMVGAVLVRNGNVLARGYHSNFGGPHAEVKCLQHASGNLRDATLYVNMEPCSHHGKTPPCADLIISRGVGAVVAAMQDPNPLVSGRGLQKLRRAGVHTRVGVLEQESRRLNRVFIKQMTMHRPYVHLKIAQSRDGRIAGGRKRWITSSQSRRRVHAMRAEYDAVLVGAGTVRADNPSLTVRAVNGRSPHVAILDGSFSLPVTRKLFAQDTSRRVFLFTTRKSYRAHSLKRRVLAARGIAIIPIRGSGSHVPLRQVLNELQKRRIESVLVEGGADVFTQFLTEGLVDELTVFSSPDSLGTGLPALSGGVVLRSAGQLPGSVQVRRSGRDEMLNVLFNQGRL